VTKSVVAAALPRALWIAEIDLHVDSDGETLVVGHLLAAIPGQRAAQLLRQFAHMFGERADHGCGVPARDLEKRHKAGMALDQRRDVRVVRPGEKITFPASSKIRRCCVDRLNPPPKRTSVERSGMSGLCCQRQTPTRVTVEDISPHLSVMASSQPLGRRPASWPR
jgi:hypothetical protein